MKSKARNKIEELTELLFKEFALDGKLRKVFTGMFLTIQSACNATFLHKPN